MFLKGWKFLVIIAKLKLAPRDRFGRFLNLKFTTYRIRSLAVLLCHDGVGEDETTRCMMEEHDDGNNLKIRVKNSEGQVIDCTEALDWPWTRAWEKTWNCFETLRRPKFWFWTFSIGSSKKCFLYCLAVQRASCNFICYADEYLGNQLFQVDYFSFLFQFASLQWSYLAQI